MEQKALNEPFPISIVVNLPLIHLEQLTFQPIRPPANCPPAFSGHASHVPEVPGENRPEVLKAPIMKPEIVGDKNNQEVPESMFKKLTFNQVQEDTEAKSIKERRCNNYLAVRLQEIFTTFKALELPADPQLYGWF